MLCLCARLFICALWSPAGKGLTSWLSFVVSTVCLSLSHWYPGSGVVLDCIDSLLTSKMGSEEKQNIAEAGASGLRAPLILVNRLDITSLLFLNDETKI